MNQAVDTHNYHHEDHHHIQHRQSRSKLKQSKPTQSFSSASSAKQHHHKSVKSNSNHNKTPDHLAAAIELSTANAAIPPAPAAGMYWSRTLTYGRGPSRPLRAHTANLIGEKLYVFGGCDTSLCFNTLYILDMGKIQ